MQSPISDTNRENISGAVVCLCAFHMCMYVCVFKYVWLKKLLVLLHHSLATKPVSL